MWRRQGRNCQPPRWRGCQNFANVRRSFCKKSKNNKLQQILQFLRKEFVDKILQQTQINVNQNDPDENQQIQNSPSEINQASQQASSQIYKCFEILMTPQRRMNNSRYHQAPDQETWMEFKYLMVGLHNFFSVVPDLFKDGISNQKFLEQVNDKIGKMQKTEQGQAREKLIFFKLLYENHFLIINFLSKRKNLRNIANYLSPERMYQNNTESIFKFWVQKGEQYFSCRGMHNLRCILQVSDLTHFFLSQLGGGILQLSSIGIFHLDLAIENTIITNGRAFKIIDFDAALYLGRREDCEQLWTHTRKMLIFLCETNSNRLKQEIIYFIVAQRMTPLKDKRELLRLNREKTRKQLLKIARKTSTAESEIDLDRRVNELHEYLRSYMLTEHHNQYVILSQFLTEQVQGEF